MRRRRYLKSVAASPLIPSLNFGEIKFGSDSTQSPPEEEYWEISSGWIQNSDWGKTVILKNDEVEHEWEFESYTVWQKTTLLNTHRVAGDEVEYVADLFDLNLYEMYLDPPYFYSRFKGEAGEIRIQQGKYSDFDYKYYIRTPEKEREYGSNDMENMITDIRRKLYD